MKATDGRFDTWNLYRIVSPERPKGGQVTLFGIPRQPFMTRPTYLGVAHSAFPTGDPAAPEFRPPNLTLMGGIDGHRLDDRRELLAQFDGFRRDSERHGGGG